MILQTTTIAALAMLTIVAAATSPPLCDDLRSDMRERNVRLFTKGEEKSDRDPFLEEHKCISSTEEELSYFACKPGFEAFVRNIDDLQILDDPDIILDIDQLRLLPGNEEGRVLDCLPQEVEEPFADAFPQCDELRGILRERNIRFFVEGEEETDPFLEEHKCASPSGVISYFACKPGFDAVLRNIDDLEILSDTDIIFNINQLRLLPGNDAEGNILNCLPQELLDSDISTAEETDTTQAPSTEAPSTEAPSTEAPSTEAPSTEAPSTEAPSTEAPSTEAPSTEAPSTEGDAPSTEAPSTEGEAPSTEAPSTEAPSTQPPKSATTPPPLPMCSDVTGYHFKQFRRESRPRVCEYSCRFPVSIYGIISSFRTRRYYNCCEGEAERVGSAFRPSYTCPQ